MTPAKVMNIFSNIVGVRDREKEVDWLFDNMDI